MLIRNKVPKVFWITKYKRETNGKLMPTSRASNPYCYEENSSVFRNSERFERYPSLIKRSSTRPNYPSRVEHRICNDYSSSVKFKIQKINRNLIKPFAVTRYPKAKKNIELDSTSTKRSSRESSKHKISPVVAQDRRSTINLVKVEHFEEPEKNYECNFMHESLLQISRTQNEDLKKEIQSLRFHGQLDEEMEMYHAQEQPAGNFQLEFHSIHSYHDNDFDDAYSEYEQSHPRNRGISG